MATDLERLVVSLEANIKKFERELAKSRGVADRSLRDVENSVSASTARIEATMGRLGGAIRTGIAGALASITFGNITKLSDSFTKVQNSLKVTGLTGDRLSATYQQLFDLAQKNGTPLEALAALYSSTAQSQKELNASSAEVVRFTDAVSTALRAGGVAAVQADQALGQLAQALRSGKVQWEDLESVVDSAPTIMQAAAAGIQEAGGSVGQLIKLVKDGKISSEALFRGITAGLPAVQALADVTKETSSQALARLNNALINMVGRLDEATGMSDNAVVSLDNFASAVKGIGKAIPGAIELLKGLAKQAQDTASAFGNLPVFKSLADKFGSKEEFKPVIQQLAERFGSPETAKAIDKALNGSIASLGSKGGVEGIDKLREAFKSKGVGEAKPSAPSGPGNMFDQIAEADRKALAPKAIKASDYAPKDDKEKKGKGGGGGASKEKLNDYQKEIEAIEKRTRGFDNEREAVGKSAIEVAKAEASFRLLEAAKKANLPVTDELRAKVDTLSLAYANAKVQLDEAEDRQRRFEAAARQTGATLADAFSDAIVNGEKLNVVVDRLIKSLASRGISSIFDSLFAKDGAGTSLLGSVLKGGLSLNPTGRAGGGPVYPGRAYTVGESGRETFVPTSPGRVIPNRSMGGASVTMAGDNIYITPAQGVTPEQMIAALGQRDRQLQRNINGIVANGRRRYSRA